MKKLLLFLMTLAFALPPAIAGEKTVTISRNEGIYKDSQGVYYCNKGDITMTFSSGMNNINYLVEHQQVVFDIFSTNYVIKKIKFNCLDNTTNDNLDCFYWGPSTIHELGAVANYVPTGTYTYSGYVGTWVGGSTPSKYVKFVTEGKPVRFGSVEITYEKEFGDIYDLVTQNSEIADGQTYVLVSKYDSRAMGKEELHGNDPVKTFSSTPVTLLAFDQAQNNYMKVKVTDEVSLMKLESSGYSNRPWYIKIGDNYLRRRSGDMQGSGGPSNGEGWNIYTVSSVPNGLEIYFRTAITVNNNNNNALIRFEHNSTETNSGNKTFAIRHYNGGDLFRVIDYNSANNQYATNQRVYLYKPAESHEVTTECIPSNGGYITLGNGILTDNQGRNWSQHYDNVTFFVGSAEGYGIGEVTITDINSKAVTVLQPTATSDFGNDYSFEMPDNDVKITANFLQPYNIDTICTPANGGVFNFISGYTDFNGQHKSNEGKTVTFMPEAAPGYVLASVSLTDEATGTTTVLMPDADGVYSFVMPGNNVTVTAVFNDDTHLYNLWSTRDPEEGGNVKINAQPNNASTTAASGSSVSVEVWTNWGYRISAVTAVNITTGEPVELTTLSTGADHNSYSFTMPSSDVRIDAHFYRPLFLLGTVMGRTNWAPAGPEFSYDANNVDAEYSLDVYFKGIGTYGVNSQGADPYGYFSLSTGITNFDWTQRDQNSGDWSGVTGRLAAEFSNPDQNMVGNGSTAQLFNDRPDNAFKIPAGVYRITVNKAMSHVSITQLPGHLYFDPESNSTVELGDVVTISSDLEQIVQEVAAIYGMTEDDQSFRHSTDGTYPANVPGNTAQLTQTGTTTVQGVSYIGQIKVEDAAQYNVIMPGTITTICDPEHGGTITLTGTAADGSEIEGQTVNFAVDANVGFSLGSVTVVIDGSETNVPVTDNGDGTYSFEMPAGNVTVTAHFDLKGEIFKLVTATEQILEGKTYTYVTQLYDKVLNYISPDATPNYYSETDIVGWAAEDKSLVILDGNAGFFTTEDVTDVNAGRLYRSAYYKTESGYYIGFDLANATGDFMPITLYASRDDVRKFTSEVYAISGANTIMSAYEYSGSHLNFDWTVFYHAENFLGNEYLGFAMGRPSLNPEVWLYKLAEPYNITTVVEPDNTGMIAIEQTLGVSGKTALEGITVTVTPIPEDGYAVSSLVVTVDGTEEVVEATRNIDGSYSFVMPSADVTVTATFDTGYTIDTETYPDGAGEIVVASSACAGQDIAFSVTPNEGYALDYVRLVNWVTGEITTPTDNGDGTFSFEMPAADVTIRAYFIAAYSVEFVIDPEEGGAISYIEPELVSYPENENVIVEVETNLGYVIESVTMTDKETGDVVSEIEFDGNEFEFTMPALDVIVTVHLKFDSPLSYIEYPGTYGDGDEVTVTDQLVGTWVAQKYLWAKDQGQRSNFYLEKDDDEDLHDYLRIYYPLQHRDWDQSNWVMLDFSTIPEFAGYSQQQLMVEMNKYVDNQIEAGSIKGTYRCVMSDTDPFGIYDGPIKIQHIIELSERPTFVKNPTTIGPNNTLGYPGFQNDPQEKAGKYYSNPVANYAYNHYTPANFLRDNTKSEGISIELENEDGENVEEFRAFFMRPKDQEVVQVWGVWLGKYTNEDEYIDIDDVFVVYEKNLEEGYNRLGVTGAFRVESWEYNINETDDDGKPTSYGPPAEELQKNSDYTFHAAIQYSPLADVGPSKAPRRAGVADEEVEPEFYNVYPLDMTTPRETYTDVKEVQSRDAVTIVDIRYYNIMGQESKTPFDGINIMVVRYKDGSMISKKVLK